MACDFGHRLNEKSIVRPFAGTSNDLTLSIRFCFTDKGFEDSNLQLAVFEEANLASAQILGCNLAEAELRGAVLSGANLGGSKLTGLDLRDLAAFEDLMVSQSQCEDLVSTMGVLVV